MRNGGDHAQMVTTILKSMKIQVRCSNDTSKVIAGRKVYSAKLEAMEDTNPDFIGAYNPIVNIEIDNLQSPLFFAGGIYTLTLESKDAECTKCES